MSPLTSGRCHPIRNRFLNRISSECENQPRDYPGLVFVGDGVEARHASPQPNIETGICESSLFSEPPGMDAKKPPTDSEKTLRNSGNCKLKNEITWL